MSPIRKRYEPLGQPTQAMATGVGAVPPGMPMLPQAGRTGPQLPQPFAGSSRAQQPPELPLPMTAGGPLSPMNVQSQGMLEANKTPARVPVSGADLFGAGTGSGMMSGGGAMPGMGGTPVGLDPQVLMRLLVMLGKA